jgi:branched-subunit amino acid aminotransferase/4-amino-4-deoxychorismate lyase
MKIIQAQSIMLTHPEHARKSFAPEYEQGSAFMLGSYCPIDQAGVPMVDMGFMHADAAYDVVSVSKGQFFRLDDHLERFEKSCEKFRLTNPYSRQQTAEILTNLVKLAGTQEAYVWWCVTRGVMQPGANRADVDAFDNMFYAFVIPYMYIADDEQRSRGLDISVSQNFIRIPSNSVDPTAKNLHWMDMKLALFEATDAGKEWSVLTDDEGFLTEAPGANIFLIKGDTLFTPDSGCLEGITRKTTLELAEKQGLKACIGKVTKEQLLDADEAFITSTAGGIMPINSVDDVVLGGCEGPGELTTRLHNLYWESRWGGWLTTHIDYESPISGVGV